MTTDEDAQAARAWARVGLEVMQERKRQGLSQGKLAAIASVSGRTIGTLERGGQVGLQSLRLVSAALWSDPDHGELRLRNRRRMPMSKAVVIYPDDDYDPSPRPVGLGLDDAAADLTPEQIETVRAVIRGMKPPPEPA